MQLNGGAGRGGRSRGLPALAEINVTPFVDVALVLLIIFMITAHVMDTGIDIQVPKTKSVESSSKELPVVQISKTAEIYLGNEQVNVNKLVDEIHTKYPGQEAVYIRADAQTPFGSVAYVMSELGTAKLSVQVVTQPDDRTGNRSPGGR